MSLKKGPERNHQELQSIIDAIVPRYGAERNSQFPGLVLPKRNSVPDQEVRMESVNALLEEITPSGESSADSHQPPQVPLEIAAKVAAALLAVSQESQNKK